MNELLIFFTITILFFVFLMVKYFSGRRFCTLCLGVVSTWSLLLILHYLNRFDDLLLVSPLLGASLLGTYYLVEKKTKESWHIFRLPFFLSLLFVAYLLLDRTATLGQSFWYLVFLWLLFLTVWFYRRNRKVGGLIKQLIACCRDW